jgi:SNF2 family DNA or RNA helicase
MYLIDGGDALGRTISYYRTTYFTAGAHKGFVVYDWRLKKGAKDRIDKLLSSFCLSMSKDDWLKLPPVIYNEITVCMSKAERKLYDDFQKEKVIPLLDGAVSGIDDSTSAVIGETAAVLSNKLLQMANGAVYDENGYAFHVHDRKLDALADIVDTSNGQPLLVFYSYKHDLKRIQTMFPEAVVLKGSDDITRWNNGEIPILLCHPASAGYGINLQEGSNIIVWFGLPWSLEQYQQSIARLHRQGQEKPVIVHHIITENTLDERVLKALQRKDATQKSLLDALKGYLLDG